MSVVKRLLRTIDSGATWADFKITLLDGLQWQEILGNLVSPSAIANCFRRAEFVPPSTNFEEVVESESVSWFETDFDVDSTFEEYGSSDSHLQCSPMLSSAADIINSIRQSTEDAEDSNDDAGTLFPRLLSVKLILVS